MHKCKEAYIGMLTASAIQTEGQGWQKWGGVFFLLLIYSKLIAFQAQPQGEE